MEGTLTDAKCWMGLAEPGLCEWLSCLATMQRLLLSKELQRAFHVLKDKATDQLVCATQHVSDQSLYSPWHQH